jgi:ornithine racemase
VNRRYPCIEVDLKKITHNTKIIVDKCNELGIQIFGVTKVFCAQEPIVKAEVKGGISAVADSRLINIKRMQNIHATKVLLRIPRISDVYDVVKYCDVSLNSEIETIKKLSDAAHELNKIHKIILMIDLGDLREGVWEDRILYVVENILKLTNVKLIGIGTNLTCYGGVIPDDSNLGKLVEYKNVFKNKFGIEIDIVSGGNSSSLYKVIDGTIPKGINNLRIGEGIVLGRETAFGKRIDGCYDDAFIIKGEIVEIKEKPSIPLGNIGMDAFGKKPHFENKGIMKRAIIAIGRQDIKLDGLFPIDSNIEIIGASSDHLIINVTDCQNDYKIGDIVDFKVDYGCLLQAMTSEYIYKYYIR